jgi:hypothetical protein
MTYVVDGAGLRRFVSRLLGWTDGDAVERALMPLYLAMTYRTQLVLCGQGDLVPVAHALHRWTLGTHRPFVVCDPRRGDRAPSVRSPVSFANGGAACQAARGGSLCMRGHRLPRTFPSLAAQLRETHNVVPVICVAKANEASPFLIRPEPIWLPPLAARMGEVPRVVDEYARDAIVELRAPNASFTDDDRDWVLQCAAASLAEIEKATLRLVALKISGNVRQAAARLGMAPVSLSRWVGRRKPLPPGFHRLDHSPSAEPPQAPPGEDRNGWASTDSRVLPWPPSQDTRTRIEWAGDDDIYARQTIADIWRQWVEDMLDERRANFETGFVYDDHVVRSAAERWLALIKPAPASTWSREAVAGLEALLAKLAKNDRTR